MLRKRSTRLGTEIIVRESQSALTAFINTLNIFSKLALACFIYIFELNQNKDPSQEREINNLVVNGIVRKIYAY